jgi:hypothetical protein
MPPGLIPNLCIFATQCIYIYPQNKQRLFPALPYSLDHPDERKLFSSRYKQNLYLQSVCNLIYFLFRRVN